MSSHAERALARFNEIDPLTESTLDEIQSLINALDAIEQTREQPQITQQDARRYMQNQPGRKVPQPLTKEEVVAAGFPMTASNVGILKDAGLGIYRIADIKAACGK